MLKKTKEIENKKKKKLEKVKIISALNRLKNSFYTIAVDGLTVDRSEWF